MDDDALTRFHSANLDESSPTAGATAGTKTENRSQKGVSALFDPLKGFLDRFPQKISFPVREFGRATFFDLIGRYDLAEAEYSTCIEIYPRFHEIYNSLAAVYKKQGRFKEALEYYRKALRMDPKNPKVWNDAAVCYIFLEMPGKAIDAFKKSLEIDDSLLPTRYNLALLYREVGRPDLAKAEIREILRMDPGYRPALELLREIRNNRGR